MGTRVSKEEVKTPHFFFGQVATRNEFNRELIVVFKMLLRDDEYDEWERGHKIMTQMNKESLLVAESYEKEHIKKYFTCCECPADYEMSIVYERFDNLYKTELAKREAGPSKLWYKQEELFLIFYQLLTGVKEFQLRGFRFGDIRPSNMVITSSTKKIKMINIYSFPWENTALDKVLDKYDNTTKFYLAPEQIEFINSPSRNATYPNPKTEAFSLGLTILQAAILQNSEDLYNVNPRSINTQLLEKRIIILEQKYPLLKKYLSKLLAVKPEERYSCGQLWSVLKNYSEKITQFQKFTPKETEQSRALQNFRKDPK